MYNEISNPLEYLAGIYLRVSSEDINSNGVSDSIANQKSMLLEFAKKQKITIVETYIDDGFTGTNFDRPGFQKLLSDIEAKKINMVMSKDLSRLGRDYIQTGYYLEKYFPEKRVRYVSLLDGIDTGIDSSINDITPFKALLNDMYAKDISKKIKSVKQDSARQGLYMSYIAPYGYKKQVDNHNQLIVNTEVSWVVQRIFNMALQGMPNRKIAETLSMEKIKTPLSAIESNRIHDEQWGSTTIKRILTNEIYIGNTVQGKRKKINYKSKKIVEVPKEQWIRVDNTHEPIIDKDTFDKVQLRLDKRNVQELKP